MSAARQHAPGPPTASRRLTPRQAAFVAAYARDAGRAGAAAAAREAGYGPRAAHVRGHRLLRTDYVLAAIAHQPGGKAALEHLAATARSPYIRALVDFVTADDSGIRVVAHGDRTLVLTDRSAAAARRFALELEHTRAPA